jgi:hypothetical protein
MREHRKGVTAAQAKHLLMMMVVLASMLIIINGQIYKGRVMTSFDLNLKNLHSGHFFYSNFIDRSLANAMALSLPLLPPPCCLSVAIVLCVKSLRFWYQQGGGFNTATQA